MSFTITILKLGALSMGVIGFEIAARKLPWYWHVLGYLIAIASFIALLPDAIDALVRTLNFLPPAVQAWSRSLANRAQILTDLNFDQILQLGALLAANILGQIAFFVGGLIEGYSSSDDSKLDARPLLGIVGFNLMIPIGAGALGWLVWLVASKPQEEQFYFISNAIGLVQSFYFLVLMAVPIAIFADSFRGASELRMLACSLTLSMVAVGLILWFSPGFWNDPAIQWVAERFHFGHR